MGSGEGGGDPPPQTSTQTVLDPALLPLLHGVGLIGRTKHGHTATPGGGGVSQVTADRRQGKTLNSGFNKNISFFYLLL